MDTADHVKRFLADEDLFDIIDPRDTRPLLIHLLETMPEGKQDFMPPKKHGIVPI
jgi:hypothetical protein